MDKHYVDQILEIFKNEKNSIIITNNYEPEIIKLFDLENCNINTLRAIRDAVVFRIDMVKQKDMENRFFYSTIISYITTVIDTYIYTKDGDV